MQPRIGVAVSLNWILERPEDLRVRYWRDQEVQASTGETGQLLGRPVGLEQLMERPVVCVCVKPGHKVVQEPVTEQIKHLRLVTKGIHRVFVHACV